MHKNRILILLVAVSTWGLLFLILRVWRSTEAVGTAAFFASVLWLIIFVFLGLAFFLADIELEKLQRTRAVQSSSRDGEGIYLVGAFITWIVTFFSSWVYCTATYGFLFGFGLGWIPSAILAAILAFLWPLIALVVIAIVLFLMLSK